MARRFDNWIGAFVQYTEGVKSPEVYRRWSAASAVASALQRRVWMRLGRQNLYPNLYVLLIGDPGTGKSNAIKFARNVVRKLPPIHLTPARITAAAFYMELEEAKGTIINVFKGMDMYRYHALTAMVDEFSVFVRPGMGDFMSDLADLFDCPDPFESKTKHAGESVFPNSWLNIIGGATSKYLKETWSGTVLDEGFPSRCIIVHSDDIVEVRLFDADEEEAEKKDNEMQTELAKALEDIALMRGKFTWEEKAKAHMTSWHKDGLPPIPRDIRLQHYNHRRVIHAAKLAMICSAAKRDDQEILLEDLKDAKEMLLHAENHMTDALEPVGANPIRDQMVMARRFVEAEYRRTKKLVPEHKIRNILLNEIDPAKMRSVIAEMIYAGWIKQSELNLPEGARHFKPGGEE
jgi:hypothetical protein